MARKMLTQNHAETVVEFLEKRFMKSVVMFILQTGSQDLVHAIQQLSGPRVPQLVSIVNLSRMVTV